MAARARGSGTGWAVAVVVISIFFVLSTILAIVFYTKIEEAQTKANDAQNEMAKFVLPAEKALPEVADIIETQRKTTGVPASVVRTVLDENSRLKQIIAGLPNVPYDGVKKALEQVGMAEGQVLINEIKRIQEELQRATDLSDRLTREAADERKRRVAVETEKAQQQQAYEQSVAQLQAELDRKQQQVDTFRGQVDTQFQTLATRVTELQTQRQQDVNDLRSQIEQHVAEKQILQRRLQDLQRAMGGPKSEAIDPSLVPDGEVISLLPEENLVFVNRGRKDHILLGMTFEVFSRKTGVIKDDTGELRGKGTVEVVSISENSAVCRVVRVSRAQQIIEGDLIANIIYDANFTFKFNVYGDFDLDNTGTSSITDRRRVETMVTEWGGNLVEKLSYDTDFLVLGKEPPLPEVPKNPLDPVEIQRSEEQKKKFETYNTLVAEARALRIPILNQNRFLALVGYYQR